MTPVWFLYAAIAALTVATIAVAMTQRDRRAHMALSGPAGNRSLDQAQLVCKHERRPAAVVPHWHDAPVGWVCPDCLADRPEPPPYGCALDPNRPYVAGVITADRINAGTVVIGDTIRARQMGAVARIFDIPPALLGPTSTSITYENAAAEQTRRAAVLAAEADRINRTAMHHARALANLGRGWPIDPTDDTRPL